MKLDIEIETTETEDLSAGIVYSTGSTVCLSLGNGKAARLAVNGEEMSIAILEHPARPTRIIGRLSGIKIKKIT